MDYCTKSRPNLVAKRTLGRLSAALIMTLLMAACDSDTRTTTTTPLPQSEADWSIQVPTTAATLIEGEGTAAVALSIVRGESAALPIALSASGATDADEQDLSWQFDDASIGTNESTSTLTVQLAIGAKPLLAHTRTLQISGNDGSSAPVIANWSFNVQPTDKPDVYLIVGQSNAMGFSEDDSRQSLAGQLDAPNDRIFQLNVTGNDEENFATVADFTTNTSLYNVGDALSPALDPLHVGYNSNTNDKEGERIGFGLSFAKQALGNTTADIYLVPAAWSDTGFCRRTTNRFPGMGWNATEKANDALAGTLLYERAVARADITLSLTDGILRGILWHQGEADSDDQDCADVYADNLAELAAALRTNIAADARGAAARGNNSDIPFVVGTMSMGADGRGSQLPFGTAKLVVDAAQRNVAQTIPVSGFVNNDDLVLPAYPCGEGTCVHFGAAALREMGVRYYRELSALLP